MTREEEKVQKELRCLTCMGQLHTRGEVTMHYKHALTKIEIVKSQLPKPMPKRGYPPAEVH